MKGSPLGVGTDIGGYAPGCWHRHLKLNLSLHQLSAHPICFLWSVHSQTFVRSATLLWLREYNGRAGIYIVSLGPNDQFIVGTQGLHEGGNRDETMEPGSNGH